MPALQKPIVVTQPDGTELTIVLKGDEFYHVTQSIDGYLLKENQAGFMTYARTDATGKLSYSDVVARNVDSRGLKDLEFLKTIHRTSLQSEILQQASLDGRLNRAFTSKTRLRSTNAPPPGLLATYPTTGSPKSLVILVNFADSTLKPANTGNEFSKMLNQPGYDLNGHVGSVRDFYRFNSGGLFSPDFVVVGPVTVSKPMAYYGANDSLGNDLRPTEMIYEACQKAAGLVNYANFDYDNNGIVDNVYVFYAGKGEADGGVPNTIWPHSWNLSGAGFNLVLNGKRIDAYACSGELDGQTGKRTGMGTFTHEYGHILGLTDMYDVDYEKHNGEALDLNYWSLMAYGAYNNKACTPPCLTFAERFFLGWAQPVELDSTQDVTLTDLGTTNQGYIIKTSNPGEYFLLENRQRTTNVWDRFLPDSTYHGMLAYHIDMRTDHEIAIDYWGTTYTVPMSDLWTYNVVNAIAGHQCCDIEEADNEALVYDGTNATDYKRSIGGDPFPGTSVKRQFSDITKPSMLTWDGNRLVKPLTEITETNGVIRFKFMDFSGFTKSPVILPPYTVGPYSFTAIWRSVINATSYKLNVYTLENDTKQFLNGYTNLDVVDTFLTVNVANDLTTYYYEVLATNNNTLFTPRSDSIKLTTTDGTPVALTATKIDPFAFQANWKNSTYATGYYLDVFSIDKRSGDTTWINGYKNKLLIRTNLLLTELDDQTDYRYRVRGTNGRVVSRTSTEIPVRTAKASEILVYAKDRVLNLKGMDKGGTVVLHRPDGSRAYYSSVNQIVVDKPGVYLITTTIDGKEKHFKMLIQ
jgi:M6 family metalloprotease-like protein